MRSNPENKIYLDESKTQYILLEFDSIFPSGTAAVATTNPNYNNQTQPGSMRYGKSGDETYGNPLPAKNADFGTALYASISNPIESIEADNKNSIQVDNEEYIIVSKDKNKRMLLISSDFTHLIECTLLF